MGIQFACDVEGCEATARLNGGGGGQHFETLPDGWSRVITRLRSDDAKVRLVMSRSAKKHGMPLDTINFNLRRVLLVCSAHELPLFRTITDDEFDGDGLFALE
jgi:hypothetical protein